MKLTLSWLRDHLDTAASLGEVADALTDLGLEVEGVSDPAAALAPFTLARVLEARPHPNADRLRVCRVLTDEGERQVVCGAPNAREGIVAVMLKPGQVVPATGAVLQVGTIRGVESHGMMASERELGLSDEHEGIIELPSGEVGEGFADWLARHDPARVDPVVEIKVTPNRPDALGIRGIARDLAARGLGTLKALPGATVEGRGAPAVSVSIDPDAAGGCPAFALRVIEGVRNGPSPAWLQARLRAVGLRPISFLVDVTNFMTMDASRPLHVFDADQLRGDLRVHRARGGEALVALDGKTYEARAGDLLISDDAGPQSLAGIMGGEASGVTEATTRVVVESALWDPLQVAATGRALRIASDARHRFERGVDPQDMAPGLDRAVAMIQAHAGGTASEMVVAGQVPDEARSYRFDPDRLRTLVGLDVEPAEQARILGALGFRVEGGRAWAPSWRPDVRGEADLVEEVARVASLSRLTSRPLPRAPGVAPPVLTPMQARLGAVRRAVAALGYAECVTYAFIDGGAAALFGGGGEATRIENPIASDMSHLRPSLLPGLLAAAARNQARGAQGELALFEAGEVFTGGEPGEERAEVAGLLVGRGLKEVHGGARPVDVFDAKGDAEAALAAMGAPPRVQVGRGGPPWWHPGRHGVLSLGPKKVLGAFGELHPKVLRALDVRGPAVAFVLWPGEVPFAKAGGTARPALDLPDLQAVERDFAFVVDARTEAEALRRAAEGADKALVAGVRVFDAFEGGALPEGTRSVALAVRLQPRGATLTEAEIEAASARVVEKVGAATGARLRG